MKKLLPYIAIIIAMLIWAVSGIAIKEALFSFTSLTLLVMRFTLAIVVMLIIGLCCRHSALLRLQKLDKKDIPLFLLAGFFQPCLYYLLETYTYDALLSPTIAETLLSTAPLLAPLWAWVFLRERVTRNNILGIIISTLGMVLLVMVGGQSFQIGNPWGVLTAFLSVSTAVLYSVMLRRIPTKYSSLTIVFYVQLCGLLLFYPLRLIREGFVSPLPMDISLWTPQLWQSLGCMTYLALFATVTAFILFCYSVRQIGVTRGNVFNNIRPLFTALIMFFAFGEHLPPGKWVGMALIIIGLFISQREHKSQSTIHNSPSGAQSTNH